MGHYRDLINSKTPQEILLLEKSQALFLVVMPLLDVMLLRLLLMDSKFTGLRPSLVSSVLLEVFQSLLNKVSIKILLCSLTGPDLILLMILLVMYTLQMMLLPSQILCVLISRLLLL